MGAALLLAAVLAAAPPLALQTLDGRAAELRPSSVMLFWRADCTPCRLEMSELPALRAAAVPLQLRLVGLQGAPALRAGLRAAGLSAADSLTTPDDPARVLSAWGGAPPRLPLAVALDARGQVCGRRTGLVGRDQLAQWARACAGGGRAGG